MSLPRNRKFLSVGIERIDVRNLLPPPGMDLDIFSPAIDISAVSRNSENVETESHTIYKGAPQQFSCNPSWTSISGFDPSPFVGQSQVTELSVRFHCKTTDSPEEEDTVFFETIIDLSKLFRLENFSLATLHSIPRNSIFFWVDDKTLLMENSIYISLRKSKQISARNSSVATATLDDKLINDALSGDMEEGTSDSILNEMNSMLVDEDERNIALRDEIDVGLNRVSTLRSEAETFLQTTTKNSSSAMQKEPSAALQLLELQQLEALVETAEAEVVFEETALSSEVRALALAKQNLDVALQKWTDITTRDSSIQTTEELIKQKKNELIHTKFLLDARRLKLFGELSTIYPIGKVVKDSSTSSGGNLLRSRTSHIPPSEDGSGDAYAIRGVELPMFIDNSLKDDEQISTALGYIVHILLLTSKYLQISLRYEVIYSSSRSMIRDAVLGRGSTLPLYKRGVERERFDRALIWLQKNVEQLMDRMGYKYSRKQSLLHNLKHLFDCHIFIMAYLGVRLPYAICGGGVSLGIMVLYVLALRN